MQRRCHQRLNALLKDLLSSEASPISNTEYEIFSDVNKLQGCRFENVFEFQCHSTSAFTAMGEQNLT